MNPPIRWPDKTLPVEIHCETGVLTGIEAMAADGLLALPRIGLGIGGLLFGNRVEGGVAITRSVEIDCSHALGPAFVLTPEELAAGLTAASEADTECGVVGWYCSKTRGPLELTEQDHALFDSLCPEPWHLALLLRPSQGKLTTAIFGLRGESGFLMGTPTELAWPELAAFQVAAPVPVVEPLPMADTPLRVPTPAQVERGVELLAAEIPVAMPRTGTLFGIPEIAAPPARESPRWPKRVLIAILVLASLGAAAFFTRGYWMPKPPVALLASSDWRGLVSVTWNSEALGERESATLVIAEGGAPVHTVRLNAAGIRAGWYQLDCRPGNVTVTLRAGNLTDSMTVQARAETYLPESGISK